MHVLRPQNKPRQEPEGAADFRGTVEVSIENMYTCMAPSMATTAS